MESSGVRSSGFLDNMVVYIIMLSLFVVIMLVILGLSYIPSLRTKMKNILKKTYEQTFWNNTIRSLSISYIETAKTFYI